MKIQEFENYLFFAIPMFPHRDLGVGGLGQVSGEDWHHRGQHQEGRQGPHEPVVEVVNLDEEGAVGKTPQHGGGDEALGDVRVGLSDKVNDHLGQGAGFEG